MNSSMTLGMIVALGAGIAIGVQQVFVRTIGQVLSPVQSGVAIHIGGTLAGVIMIAVVIMTHPQQARVDITPRVIVFALLAGTTGMLLVMGIAFAFLRVGQVTGQVVLIFAQMAVAVIVDTFALAGGQAMPLDGRRVLGLLVMALSTYLLMPRPTT